jgi:hypothetical protein
MRDAAFALIGVSLFIVGLGIIYWFTSYEPSGTVLLCAAIGLAVIPGLFLLRHAPSSDISSDHVGLFPESSVWPLVLALGAVGSGIGLVFGLWTALPGVVLLGVGLVGGILQSRA